MKDKISEELYKALACPECKAKLVYSKDKKWLKCLKCGHAYPIEEGIPNLIPKNL